MIKRLYGILAVAVLAFVLGLAPATVFAVEGDTTENETTSTTQDDTTGTEDTADDLATRQAELKSRLEQRKADMKTRVTATRQAALKKKCEAAQKGSIKSLSGRIKGLETSRNQVHENLISRLTKLSERLKTHNVDTAELDAEITQLVTLVDAFKADLAEYKQTISDLEEMDCTSDPTSFQASLEAARTARADAAASSKAVRTYLSETVKPTLKTLKAQFAQNAPTSNKTEDENSDQSQTEGGESQ